MCLENECLLKPHLYPASPVDCAEEKSMFCRISRGRDSDGEVKYHPFRLTPYQLTLRDSDTSQPEPCCLLIAERVHSGYEGKTIQCQCQYFTIQTFGVGRIWSVFERSECFFQQGLVKNVLYKCCFHKNVNILKISYKIVPTLNVWLVVH